MTKTGKPDAYWATVMKQYAQGAYKFTTGRRPGGRKWKAIMQRIDSCPLTPSFNQKPRQHDFFGNKIPCKCGYHDSAPEPEAAGHCSTSTVSVEQAQSPSTSGMQQEPPAPQSSSTKDQISCAICNVSVSTELFSDHLSNFHAEGTCGQCGEKVMGLLKHIEKHHNTPNPPQQQPSVSPTQQPKQKSSPAPSKNPLQQPLQSATPSSASSPHVVFLRPPEVNWIGFLPKQFLRVIKPADREWIAQILYEPTGQLRQQLQQNWFHPPNPPKVASATPDPVNYFRQRLFIWAPMRMWGIPLKCNQCSSKMHHSGIYTKAREVIDVDSRYYLVGGDYPRCSKCVIPVCPWSCDILSQLDPAHRNKFPAVLTTQLALDRKCVTMLKPRTAGNSSSYLWQALQEIHSEKWARDTIEYLSDCELHKKGTTLVQGEAMVYREPPAYSPLPLAQWFETAHTNEILGHVDEMRGVITSSYGRILKMDSTKKITKKLAGGVADTATWMNNISNEYGQVLNCVLTTGEGAGLDDVCQGIVKRYLDAHEPEPEVIYVDRDCCSDSGVPAVLTLFRPWKTQVRLDIFHFMRRFTAGLTTEHHPLYGTFCSKMSSCIFEWDQGDFNRLKEAKRSELRKKHGGQSPTDAQVLTSISSGELAKHCKRRTRGVEEAQRMIQSLLDSMWELTDSTGLHLINAESMTHVWEVQQKHIKCIHDPPGIELYTKLGAGLQKGDVVLDVYRCGRGSSSVESFHRHQCSFIPGTRSNAMHTQMYMLEGGSRWNMNRAREAVTVGHASRTRIYDIRLLSNINDLSRRVIGHALVPEFTPPGRPTGERIAVEYLLTQSNRGDLLPKQHSELGIVLPDLQIEPQEEEECPDVTVGNAADICERPLEAAQCDDTLDSSPPDSHDDSTHSSSLDTSLETSGVSHSPSSPTESVHTEEHLSSGPSTSSEERCDARGVPGWEAVDKLADFLVSLNRTITALSTAETTELLRLYSSLHPMDKTVTKYLLKSKKKTLLGPWRASRKRSGSAPGQQAAERLFMTHGQAAHRPDHNRISECVALKLLKEFQQARNRPKDNKGKTLPLPQSIVQTFSNIKQLLEDSRMVQDQTNLVLVTVNNTTVSAWLYERQKRTDRDSLLQGVQLPQKVSVVKDLIPEARDLPAVAAEHGHAVMTFNEPENREGMAAIRRRQSVRTDSTQHPASSSHYQGPLPPDPSPPWSMHQLHQPPPAPSPAWSSHGQSQLLPPPAWPMYQQCQPPPASSSAWPFQSQGQLPPPSAWSYNPSNLTASAPFGPAPVPYFQQSNQALPVPYPSSGSQVPLPPPLSAPSSSATTQSQSPAHFNRQLKWRHKKAALEDEQRVARGETPKKRSFKEDYHYICKLCGLSKSKITGHTQLRGKWYCPASGKTVAEWKESLDK